MLRYIRIIDRDGKMCYEIRIKVVKNDSEETGMCFTTNQKFKNEWVVKTLYWKLVKMIRDGDD